MRMWRTRVGPHEVAKGPVVGDFLVTDELADLVDRVHVGAQPAVHAQDAPVNHAATNEMNERHDTKKKRKKKHENKHKRWEPRIP